jgi:transcriptional regulator with XRE-family HTH domain
MIFDNIQALCAKNDTNISELERKLGLANATIRNWDKSDPRTGNLKKVADYFGVTIDSLLSENKEAR